MNHVFKQITSIVPVLASSLVLAVTFQSQSAQAQAAYGSYVGVGPAIGLTKGGNGEEREISGLIAARYKFLEAPISIRAQGFIGSGTAIVPTISYDVPINWQTDAYLGLGASVHLGGNTPVGNKTAFAIQPGIDYSLPNSNVVVFGNAVIAFDAYKRSGGTAASIQGGVGIRF
ncbi:hypothetical protein ACN4EG_01360 [Alkalinema pantanalense CENA528]|uniref:hypothetical protein n=1 Tax=Alkalinema pantanalense TaxID=1620705 RepID=UPI003D6DC7F8